MANLNWQKNKDEDHYANHNGARYILRKRNDEYVDVWCHPPGRGWEDGIKLNEKRVRVGPAKDMAEKHAEAVDTSNIPGGSSDSPFEKAPMDGPETEFDAVPTVVSVEKTAMTDTVSIAESKQPEVEHRSDPIQASSECSSRFRTLDTIQNKPENWMFLGSVYALLFVSLLMSGHGKHGAALVILNNIKDKGKRRKIRKAFRENGYPTLAGLAV